MMVAYALWVITALALVVGGMAADLHRSVLEERQATERAELRAAAISGLAAYRLVLSQEANPEYSHCLEPFRAHPSFCEFMPAPVIRTICFHTEGDPLAEGTRPAVGAQDEESRLNLLYADVRVLARLPGVNDAMSAALRDYLAGNPPLLPHTPLDLTALPGWEGLDVSKLSNLVTFHSSGKVNVNTAPPEVFRLLGLSDRAVQAMTSFLAGPDGVRGDQDDRFFKGLTEMEPRLRDFGMDSGARTEWMDRIREDLLTTHSEYYRVRARALNEETGGQYEVAAIVHADRTGSIVAWWEHQPS